MTTTTMTLPASLQMLAPLTDEEVVGRVVDGDTAVFELLMRRHNQRLYRLARSVVRTREQAEEVLQETYLRAYANLGRFRGDSSVVTWLSRIAFHTALRQKRKWSRTRAARGGDDGLDLDSLPMSDTRSDAADALVREELRLSLTAALDRLPTGMRAIVMLRLVEGLSVRETARSLRLSESNVKVGLHRARRLLCESIERQAIPQLREEFAFGRDHCDRVVANVFQRLAERARDAV